MMAETNKQRIDRVQKLVNPKHQVLEHRDHIVFVVQGKEPLQLVHCAMH